MTAEELIDYYYRCNLPYNYGKIWKLHSGKDYRKLSKDQKTNWRWAVKDRAEYGTNRPLSEPENF